MLWWLCARHRTSPYAGSDAQGSDAKQGGSTAIIARPSDADGALAALGPADRRRQKQSHVPMTSSSRADSWVPDAPHEQLSTSHGDVTRRRFDSLYNTEVGCPADVCCNVSIASY